MTVQVDDPGIQRLAVPELEELKNQHSKGGSVRSICGIRMP